MINRSLIEIRETNENILHNDISKDNLGTWSVICYI